MSPLRTYEDWKHCIVELCQIPLTPDYVAQRLQQLNDTRDDNTRKFVASWGDDHRKKIIAWFKQAEAELAQAGQ